MGLVETQGRADMPLYLDIQKICADARFPLIYDKRAPGLKSSIIYLGRCKHTCRQQARDSKEEFFHQKFCG